MSKRELTDRVKQLSLATKLAEGRVDDDLIADAKRVVGRVDERMALSGEHTVVALAGATGSGKSSLFNAVSGTQLAEPGVRRPTTNRAMAASWTENEPTELLDWLDVSRRHLVRGGDERLAGLVLLDLPDHDSTRAENRAEVDRLTQFVDLFCWVVDPQKYADAALHERYLVPMAGHASGMVVALNQIDRLTQEEATACLADLRRILDAEGLYDARVVGVSAQTGEGVDQLRDILAERVATKQAAAERLGRDVTIASERLRPEIGANPARPVRDADVKQLNRALAEAAGAEVIQDAVLKATRQRGIRATGWPLVTWLTRFKPDPLKRLHLDVPKVSKKNELAPVSVQRTGVKSGGVADARVRTATRQLADAASVDLPRGWRDAVLAAARSHEATLPDQLDARVASADLGMNRRNHVWGIFRALQWLLIVAVVVGLAWLLADGLTGYFQLPNLPRVNLTERLTLPTALVLGGVIAGVLLGLIGRGLVEITARSRAAAAGRELKAVAGDVGQELIVGPVDKELDRQRSAHQAIMAV